MSIQDHAYRHRREQRTSAYLNRIRVAETLNLFLFLATDGELDWRVFLASFFTLFIFSFFSISFLLCFFLIFLYFSLLLSFMVLELSLSTSSICFSKNTLSNHITYLTSLDMGPRVLEFYQATNRCNSDYSTFHKL